MTRLPPVSRSPTSAVSLSASGGNQSQEVNLNVHFKVTEPQPSSPLLGNDGFVGDQLCRTRNKRFGEWAGLSYEGPKGLETEAQVWDEILRKRAPRKQARSVFLGSYDFYSFDRVLAKRAETQAQRGGVPLSSMYGHGAVGLGETWNKANVHANRARLQTWMKDRAADLAASKRRKEQEEQDTRMPLKDRIAQRRAEKEQTMERRALKRDQFEIKSAKLRKLETLEREQRTVGLVEGLAQTKVQTQERRARLLHGLQETRTTLQSEKEANRTTKDRQSLFNCSGPYDDTHEDRDLRLADISRNKELRVAQHQKAKGDFEKSVAMNIQDIRKDRVKLKRRIGKHLEEEKRCLTEHREALKKERYDARDKRLTDAERTTTKTLKAAEERRKDRAAALLHKKDFKAYRLCELRRNIDSMKASGCGASPSHSPPAAVAVTAAAAQPPTAQ